MHLSAPTKARTGTKGSTMPSMRLQSRRQRLSMPMMRIGLMPRMRPHKQEACQTMRTPASMKVRPHKQEACQTLRTPASMKVRPHKQEACQTMCIPGIKKAGSPVCERQCSFANPTPYLSGKNP